MSVLTYDAVRSHRARTYHLLPELRVTTREEAIAFVNERGFTYFWPVKGVELPSLWAAVAGARPVADEHDDPGHITWGWKDGLLGARVWYYGKVLRRRATLIALETAPYFYALSENFGSPEEDYLDQYRHGTLTQEAKMVYEALLREGPLHTLALRKATFMSDQASSYRFTRGLEELQADLKILPVGIAEAGAWKYAFIYDCVHRHFPDLPEQARTITFRAAQEMLLRRYLQSVGAVQETEILKVFHWTHPDVLRAVSSLAASGEVLLDQTLVDRPGQWIVLGELIR